MLGGDDYTAAKYGYHTNAQIHAAPIRNAQPQRTEKSTIKDPKFQN